MNKKLETYLVKRITINRQENTSFMRKNTN